MGDERTSGECPRIHFDHHDPEFARDPWAVYRDLRERCPVAYSEDHGGFWVVSRYDDVKELASDDSRFLSGQSVTVPAKPPDMRLSVPIEVDPPLFFEYRRLLNRYFSPQAAERMEPDIRGFVAEAIDDFVEEGSCDIVQDFANPIPAKTTLRLLGFPIEEWREYAEPLHAKTFLRSEHKYQEHLTRLYDEMHDRVWQGIAERRAAPRDDMVSELVHSEIDGRALTDGEVFDIVMLILHGGFDTTGAAISNAVLHLDGHHEDRERLRSEPELLPLAVEELLRYEAPQQGLARVAAEECTVGGQAVGEGDRLFLLWASANRDEEQFPEPDTVVLDRWPNRHVTFGVGAHRCLGAHLARAQIRIALGELLDRLPDFRVDHDGIERAETVGVVFGHFSIPVTFTPGARSSGDAAGS